MIGLIAAWSKSLFLNRVHASKYLACSLSLLSFFKVQSVPETSLKPSRLPPQVQIKCLNNDCNDGPANKVSATKPGKLIEFFKGTPNDTKPVPASSVEDVTSVPKKGVDLVDDGPTVPRKGVTSGNYYL